MLHQHDVEIVDDHRADKETDGLQSLPKSNRDRFRMVGDLGPGRGNGQQISHHDRGRVGGDHAGDTVTHHDRQQRSSQPYHSFGHDIDGQMAEAAGALQISASAAQRNIKSGSDRHQGHGNGIRQVKVSRNHVPKHQQKQSGQDAANPGAPVKSAVGSSLGRQRFLLGHDLGRDDLKGKRDRRDQNQQRANRADMTEAARSQGPCHRYVVEKVDYGHRTGARKQHETSRKYLGPE